MQAANASQTTAWQAEGAWTIPATVALAVTPTSGNGTQQTFAFQYTDYIGATDLIPESHHRHPKFMTTAMTLLGAGILYVAIHFAVQPNSIQWDASHTSLTFMCRVVIHNPTRASLTISNLFQERAGLYMKVADTGGTELARLISPPFQQPVSTIDAGTNSVFWPYYGIFGRFDPGTNKTVRLQLEGKLIGNSYTKPIVSEARPSPNSLRSRL